jgi:hypothetical protein
MSPIERQDGELGRFRHSSARDRDYYPDRPTGPSGVPQPRLGASPAALPREILPPCITLLVTGGKAFYNPSNTAMEAVVSLIRHLGAQPPIKNGCAYRERVLNIDFHFGISQEQ